MVNNEQVQSENNTQQAFQLTFDGYRSLQLQQAVQLNEGVQVEKLHLLLPQGHKVTKSPSTKQVRTKLSSAQVRFDRSYLMALFARTLSGGGLSDVQVQIEHTRIILSGIISREGRRTPFLARGYLSEDAGPFGGVVFYDIRLFGLPGLPAPGLIPLLIARTGKHGPVKVSGAVTLQFNPLSSVLRWTMAANGWKLPNYQETKLLRIESNSESIVLYYSSDPQQQSQPSYKADPLYPSWAELRSAEQLFFQAESMIGRGDYEAALSTYEDELWLHPGYGFIQERLMQLCLASPEQERWTKAYRLAENILKKQPNSLVSLNCLAQYAEKVKDERAAAHYYTQIAEMSREQGSRNEASLSYGKAAELLEGHQGEQAWRLWQLAHKEQPTYRPAIAALARHALKAGKYPDAERILRELIEQTPHSIEQARYHLSLAGLYRSRLRDLNNAREQLELAAPYLNEDIAFQRELAEFRLATDENLDALRILDRLAERVRLLNHLSLYAEILFRTGQILEERLAYPSAALQRYQKVLQLKPEQRYALKRVQTLEQSNIQAEPFSSGTFDLSSLQIEEKLRALQQSKQRSPAELARLHLELTQLYSQIDDVENAIFHGYQALQLQSSMEAAWQLLEEICVRSNRQKELAEIHRKMAQKALFDLDALRHLEEALRLCPDDLMALQQLSERYQKLEQWEKLLILYNRWIEALPSQERSPYLNKKAELLEGKLNRLSEAEFAYLQAYEQSTQPESELYELLDFYVRIKDWNKVERQVERLTGASTSATAQAALYNSYGSWLEERKHTQFEPQSNYQKAQELDPENPNYIFNLLRFLPEDEDEQRISLLEVVVKKLDDKEKALSYQLELAKRLEASEETSKQNKALQLFLKVVEHAPEHYEGRLHLADLYIKQKQWKPCHEQLEQLLKLSNLRSINEQISIWERLVLIYEKTNQLPLINTAIETILRLDPLYAGQDLPEEFLQEQSQELTIASSLFTLGRKKEELDLLLRAAHILQGNHPSLSKICLKTGLEIDSLHPKLWSYRFALTDPSQQFQLWEELAQMSEENNSKQERLSQLEAVVEQVHQNQFDLNSFKNIHEQLAARSLMLLSISKEYANLLEQEDRLEESLDIRKQIVSKLPSGEEKSSLQFELAIQLSQILGDKEQGQQILWSIIAEDPQNMDAFYELQQIYEEHDNFKGFIEQLEELASKATPSAERADLFYRTFELSRNFLADPKETKAFLSRSQQSAAGDFETLNILAAAYEEAEDLAGAALIYKQVAQEHTVQEQAIKAFERAGELYHRDLNEPDTAMDLYQELLLKDPTNSEATSNLKELYETLWMWQELAEIYKQQVEITEEKREASNLLFELAEIYLARMGDYEEALDTYRAALRKFPRNQKILKALQALYEELENWPAAASSLKAQVRLEIDPEILSDLHAQIAILSLERLNKTKQAQEHYELAFKQQPRRPEALEGLWTLFETTEDREAQADTAVRLAILHQKQNQTKQTRESLRKMLLAIEHFNEKEDQEAFLRKRLTDAQESALLATKLFDQLRELTNAEGETLDRSLANQFYEQELHEMSWLIRDWESSDTESSTEEIKEKLLTVLIDSDWPELKKQIDLLIQKSSNEDLLASLHLANAELSLYQLKDNSQAEKYAHGSLQMGVIPERALKIFTTIQKQKGSLQAEPLIQIIENLDSDEDKLRGLYSIGAILIEKEQQWRNSFLCFTEAMRYHPDAEKYTEYQDLLEKNSEVWAGISLEEAEQGLPSNIQEVSKALLQAWLHFQHSQDEKAMEFLEKSVSLDPDCIPSLRLLGRYNYKKNQFEAASFYFYKYLELEWESLPLDEIVEVCLSLAQISEQQEDWENALYYLEQAIKFVPEEVRVFHAQERVMQRAELWDQLRELYQKRITNPEPSDDLANLWFQQAELQIHQLHNPEAAQKAYEKVLHNNPLHADALKAIEKLREQQGKLDLLSI